MSRLRNLIPRPAISYKVLIEKSIRSLGNHDQLVHQLSLKNILNQNQEMKNIIFKIAQVAAQQIHNQHPFVHTAGQVFLGSAGDNDVLVPGVLVLLLNRVVNKTNQFDDSHLLLAKGVIETTAGYEIHRTIQEMTNSNDKALHTGNKLATLTGDLLVVSLIKHVAKTGNNKVLELIMNSLSEFSSTEFLSLRPFQRSNSCNLALLPTNLAESSLFSKGFESSMLLSSRPEMCDWAAEVGSILGLLWKHNFDERKLGAVENEGQLKEYLGALGSRAITLLTPFGNNNNAAISLVQLAKFWGKIY